VKRAISQLSDQELARLADQARASEKDVQGGLIVGLLALIGLIVVIIIVVASSNPDLLVGSGFQACRRALARRCVRPGGTHTTVKQAV